MSRLVPALVLLSCGGAGQSRECKTWVSCWNAAFEGRAGDQDRAYGPDGECWKSTPQNAHQCNVACTEATRAQGLMAGAPRECR